MRRLLVICLLAAGVLGTAGSADAFVYWANYGGEGTAGGSTIGRANLDGTGRDNSFITGASFPCGVSVDAGHVYWANGEDDTGTTIGRANIDGTGADQAFIGGASNPCFPTSAAGGLYWTNFAADPVGRADLGGMNVNQSLVTGAGQTPCGLAVSDGAIYYSNQAGNAIGRANLNGSANNPSFITGADEPCGLAVNSAHLYWANREGNTIGRANLDGSGVDQSFIAGASLPCGVAVDDTHVYWANMFTRTIGRSNLDGSGANQSFVSGAAEFPCGVAVDDLVRSTSAAVSCTPSAAAVGQPVGCTATIADTNDGPPTAPAGAVSFSSAASGASFQGGASCELAPAGASESSCSVTYLPGIGSNLVLGVYGGDAAHEGSDAVGSLSSASFFLGPVSFNRKLGTAVLTARPPGPGTVTLAGDRGAPQTLQAAAGGAVGVPIRARGSALRKLKRQGSVTVVAEVSFRPAGGGSQGEANQSIRLKRKLKKKR